MMRFLTRNIATLTLLLACLGLATVVRAGPPLVIAAATSLRPVLVEITKEFEKVSDKKVALSFSSSGHLVHQIIHGAPFDLFLAAGRRDVETLENTVDLHLKKRYVASGQIVLYKPNRFSTQIPFIRDNLLALLEYGRGNRIVIADPKYAPYGRTAREILLHLGAWEEIKANLITAKNASQAAHFAVAADVFAGFIPLSIALEEPLARAGTHILIPTEFYADESLEHTVVLLNPNNRDAVDFFEFLSSNNSVKLFRRFGYLYSNN
jgi:molybdate transport system substrate-binding protein